MRILSILALASASSALTVNDFNDAFNNKDFTPIMDEAANSFQQAIDKASQKPLADHVNDIVNTVKNQVSKIPKTKKEAMKNFPLKKTAPKDAQVKHYLRQTPHSIRQIRAENGRPPLARPHHFMGKEEASNIALYDGLDNFAAKIMSMVTGFIYTPGKESQCAISIFDSIGSWVNGVDVFAKIYMPWNWPRGQTVLQDIIASGTIVEMECDLQKPFATITSLISFEGLSELGARLAGAAPFELFQIIAVFRDKESTSSMKWRQIGIGIAIVLNYHIS